MDYLITMARPLAVSNIIVKPLKALLISVPDLIPLIDSHLVS